MPKQVEIRSLEERTFPDAHQAVQDALRHTQSPQTESSSYRLSFDDSEFLQRDEMRGVRLQLEWAKADILQHQFDVRSTIVIFGGARLSSPETAAKELQAAEARAEVHPNDLEVQAALRRARRRAQQVRYYEEARELGRLVSRSGGGADGQGFVVVTGGGPGAMEAANRGATDEGARSIGLNIVLPHEQTPNPYVTPELSFQFHYFAVRKMHFLARAKALICFPGGFGTLDELFEALTLIQTKKMAPLPVMLVGASYWQRLIDFELLLEEGLIAERDLKLFTIVETAGEAWSHIESFYELDSAQEADQGP